MPIKNEQITIGVNDVGRLFDPTYLVVLNHSHQFKLDRYRYIKNSKAKAIFSQLVLDFYHPCKVQFNLGAKGGTDFSRTDSLPITQNSPYVAIGLAVLMGAKKIGLIGVDFTPDHFFSKTGTHPLERKLRRIDAEYRALNLALKEQGVELVNLSSNSRLQSLEKKSYSEFIKKPEKIISIRSVKANVSPLNQRKPENLNIVHIAKTNCAGALWNLHQLITQYTPHRSRVITRSRVTNGRRYPKDVLLHEKQQVYELIEQADVIHFHNWLDKESTLMKPYRELLQQKTAVLQFHSEPSVLQQAFPGRDLASREDLLTLVVAQKQARFYPLVIPVPNALDINQAIFRQSKKHNDNRRLRVLYAPTDKKSYQNYRDSCRGKGYQETRSILKKLDAEGIIEACIVSDMNWQVLAELRRTCDVVIDECVTGGYHLSSLESLAQGCVTLAMLDEITHSLLVSISGSKKEDLPWINCQVSRLEKELTELAGNRARLKKIKQQSRAWMERYWRPEDIVDQYIRSYQIAIQEKVLTNKKPVVKKSKKTGELAEKVINMSKKTINIPAIHYKTPGNKNPLRSEQFTQTIRLSGALQQSRGSLNGLSCHILGNGPSVTELDLSLLQSRCVISVNSSASLHAELGRPADYYCVSDRRFLQHDSSTGYLQKARGSMFVFAGYCAGFFEDPTINYVRICGGDGISTSLRDGFYHNCSVALFACQLALWLGSKDIFLHGCEFDYAQGRFENDDSRPHDKGIYPRVRKNAALLAKTLDKMNGGLSVVGPSRLTGDFGDMVVPFIHSVDIAELDEELQATVKKY